MMLDFSIIGQNIRARRVEAGFTQEALSELLDVTPDYISKVENGAKRPSLAMLEKLGEIFKVDVYVLMCGVEANSKRSLDDNLYDVIKDWEPETKRILFKTAESLSEIDKAVKTSKE